MAGRSGQKLDLYLHDFYVGRVCPERRDISRVVLEVDSGYSPDVVLTESFSTIPGRVPPSDAVSNFLGGYMPEGNHRTAMASKRKVDPSNLFELLREFGGSISGAVSIRLTSEPSPYQPSYAKLSDRELSDLLTRAVKDIDQGISTDSRSALPGYQPKVLLALINGGWAYPQGRAHSTRILKPQVPTRPTRIFDEHYSHMLARHAGLASFGSEIHSVRKQHYLAIERFDRIVDKQRVYPIHQEDCAQALGLDWRQTDNKFQDPNWPTNPRRASVSRIAELLGSVPAGSDLILQWVQQLLFHLIMGNNDAHAKNVAIIHTPLGPRLADVYDALPNLFQKGLINYDMALSIDSVFDHRRMSVERLQREAESWRILPAETLAASIDECLVRVHAALDEVKPPKGISPGLAERLMWNSSRLIEGSEIGSPR